MLPTGWVRASSSAIEAYRYLPSEGILQIAFIQGRRVYDYPCTSSQYYGFRTAPSMGRYVTDVLKPYAASRGGARPHYARPW